MMTARKETRAGPEEERAERWTTGRGSQPAVQEEDQQSRVCKAEPLPEKGCEYERTGLQCLPYESEQRGRAADLPILTERHVQLLDEALGQGSGGHQPGKETDRPSATAGEPVAQRTPPPCSEEQRCKQKEQILPELSHESPGECCGCATDTRQQITRERQREERETSRSGSERCVRMGDLAVEPEGDGRPEKPSCHLPVRRSWRQRARRGSTLVAIPARSTETHTRAL